MQYLNSYIDIDMINIYLMLTTLIEVRNAYVVTSM